MTDVYRERFHSRYNVLDSGCWEWTGSYFSDGYGAFWDGRKQRRASRYSYTIHRGEIPDGLFACHTCDNKRCVNPDHLFLGTALDNTRDMIRKGRRRGSRGDRMRTAKLTADLVIEARRRVAAGEGVTAIAREFGVTHASLGAAVRGKTWRWVESAEGAA